jgi:hypothetical protein
MKVTIHSLESIGKLLKSGFPENVAVISFYDPPTTKNLKHRIPPVDYSGSTDRVFQIALHDIDLGVLEEFDLTVEEFFTEAEELAEFIYSAKTDGLDIICQCVYGQSRSSACAAAILEHFYKTGITIFSDYRYYPNQLVYHKIYEALGRLMR